MILPVPDERCAMRSLYSAALLAPNLLAAQAPLPVHRAAETITAEDVMHRVGVIAADSMMGRDNPSRGLELTADYVVSEFRKAGLRPVPGQGFTQRFGLTRWTVDTGRSAVVLRGPDGRATAPIGTEARYVDGTIGDAPVRGDVILMAGSPKPARDIQDRIVLLVLDYSRPLLPTLGDDIFRLAASGPKAVLLLSNRDSATFSERLRTASTPRLIRDSKQNSERVAPIIELHERSLGTILSQAGIDPNRFRRASTSITKVVPGLRAEIHLSRKVLSRAQLPNVIGVLEGSDPSLRQEYLVYSAHIDHIGLARGEPDSINNGADDNASGVAGLLELAHAFSRPGARPRRSLIFFAPSAEEPGLLGSAHFTDHPTVPLQRIVANINMDLIGRNWRDSVIAVGPELSDLGATLRRVVAAHPELRMTPIPDRWPEERIFYRSDHYNFARKGVPILFFTSGTHPDYHRPSDEPERIDGEKESRLVRLLFYLGNTIANQPERPRWTAESYRQIVEAR
jgi:hypothetical protein